MRRMTFAAVAVLVATTVATAGEDPKPAPQPAQPRVVPLQRPGAQPTPVVPRLGPAARIAALEEEVETLEAHREVKKAYVRAAEVGVQTAEIKYAMHAKLLANKVISKEEADLTKLDLELAKSQVEIRMAEMREVEVKVKFAKKRLEDAKAAGQRPLPPPGGVRPAPVDPQPRDRNADEKAVAELKAKLADIEAKIEKNAAEAKTAETEVKAAQDELTKILDIAKRGRIKAGTIEAAEAKVKDAKESAERLEAVGRKLKAQRATLQEALKQVEKNGS